MLQYAGRRWAEEGARVLLVLGLRVETTEALPAPSRWVSELSRTLPVRRLMLDPLAAGETLDLVRALAGGSPGRSEGVSSDLERFGRSEEHTSELQSRGHLVCRLLLEKQKPQTGSSRTTSRNKRSASTYCDVWPW